MLPDAAPPLKRCAIYTRKSTNHLLERDVNSLVIQRDICAAYIASQGFRGWSELPDSYDDGGFSGSHLNRPALRKLMADIEAGLIDSVVVYKIDRLTRSMVDFVRMIEVFNQRGITLTSVSQAFDTSDSMGRMILNILLTFSQFEREMIAERVRDSIRTRKAHGYFHGGPAPIGYRNAKGGLEVVPEEAEIVRFVFRTFIATKRYTATVEAAHAAGLASSVKRTRSGAVRGGRPVSSGSIYLILRNPVYIGEISGHDGTYPGQHAAIISRAEWDKAQKVRAERTRRPRKALLTTHFLLNLLWDDLGRPMRLRITESRGRTFGWYSSSTARSATGETPEIYRWNAQRLDDTAKVAVTGFLADRGRLRGGLKTLGISAAEIDRCAEAGAVAARRLEAAPAKSLRGIFAALVERAEVGPEWLVLTLRAGELKRYIEWTGEGGFADRNNDCRESTARCEIRVAIAGTASPKRRLLRLPPRDPAAAAKPSRPLLALLEEAREAQRLLYAHREEAIEELARRLDCTASRFSQLVRLNYLAPDILAAITDGEQPQSLSPGILLRSRIPLEWSQQRKLLGFQAAETKPDH